MADFCRPCTTAVFEVDATDIVGPGWYLCEGCGLHHFDAHGERTCGLPGMPDEDNVGIEPCEACAVTLDQMEATPMIPCRGDQYVGNFARRPAERLFITITRVAADGSWADIHCRSAAREWRKRQPLGPLGRLPMATRCPWDERDVAAAERDYEIARTGQAAPPSAGASGEKRRRRLVARSSNRSGDRAAIHDTAAAP